MARQKNQSVSSQRWLKAHHNDFYVKKARQQGYLSRAAYKLLELQEKDHLLRSGMTVLDLGAAPGGWSQVAVELVGQTGKVIALDILPMTPLVGVDFIQGDFTELSVLQRLQQRVFELTNKQTVDAVISDMAPNLSGQMTIDQPRSLMLVDLALDCALQFLRVGGCFVAKVFQGSGVDAWIKQVRQHFQQVKIRKPTASRAQSREIYVVALHRNKPMPSQMLAHSS